MSLRQRIQKRIQHLSGQIQHLLGRQVFLGTPPEPPEPPQWDYDAWAPALWENVRLEVDQRIGGYTARQGANLVEAFRMPPEYARLARERIDELENGHIDTVPPTFDYVGLMREARDRIINGDRWQPSPTNYVRAVEPIAHHDGGYIVPMEQQQRIVDEFNDVNHLYADGGESPFDYSNRRRRETYWDREIEAFRLNVKPPELADPDWRRRIIDMQLPFDAIYFNPSFDKKPMICKVTDFSARSIRYHVHANSRDEP